MNLILIGILLFLLAAPLSTLLCSTMRVFMGSWLTAITYAQKWHPSGQPEPVNIPKFKKFLARIAFADSYFWIFIFGAFDFIFLAPAYFFLKQKAFSFPVKIQGQFGLSVSPVEGRNDEILAMLDELGVSRVNVRVYFSGRENLSVYDDLMKKLVREKILCAVTLVQNRESEKNVSGWMMFVKDVVSRYGKDCSHFIIGTAPNRIKWGIWSYLEYQKLFRAAQKAADETDGEDVRIGGPSVIDFEWMFANAILHGIKPDFVSHNLYVDVRGKPEDGVTGFDAAGKVCFLKAMTCMSAGSKIPLWLTEVNWPLQNQEGFSPAAGPVCVSEETYAKYMARYMILCASTGYVEQIFWWQLIARGYGLVDDMERTWRKRPAYYALKTLNEQLTGCVFQKNISRGDEYRFLFVKGGGEKVLVSWVKEAEKTVPVPEGSAFMITLSGEKVPLNELRRINLTESPVFVHVHG